MKNILLAIVQKVLPINPDNEWTVDLRAPDIQIFQQGSFL